MCYSVFQKLLLILLPVTLAIVSIACSSKAQLNEVIVETQQSQTPARENRPCETEPKGDIGLSSYNKNLQTAWKQFTANGQYRLACNSDVNLSNNSGFEQSQQNAADRYWWYVYSWGRLGYPSRDTDDHLIAIVVDTSRTDPNRFGVIIFSPPRTKKTAYETYWLYRNRDLSRATVNRASGTAYFKDYSTDGTRNTCNIRWNRKENDFECK